MHECGKSLLAAAVLLAALLTGIGVRAEAPRVVGWLTGGSPQSDATLLRAFREGLKEHGWIEGTNLRFEARFAEGQLERLPGLAAELVRLKPDVIFSGSTPIHILFKQQTSTIPIVMGTGIDPVAVRLVSDLSRPGGNITGVVGFLNATSLKMLEIAASLVPRGSRVAILIDVNTPFTAAGHRDEVMRGARDLGVQAQYFEVSSKDDVMRTFAAMANHPPAAIVELPSPMLWHLRREVIDETAKLKIPSIYPFEVFADAGGLVSYSAPIEDGYRRAAYYVHRILGGAKPGDLAIEQPTRLKLVVNLKTAKAQGIQIPGSVLLRADRVIE
jgi:putative ABC transport system substrate-binding protein